jgi:hypothetical protein
MDKDILAEAKDAFAECEEAEFDNRKAALEDLRFARLGQQWPAEVEKQRELEGRPCLTINKLPAFLRQVINDARQNKSSIKVHPVDSGSDPQTAKVLDGLIRNIEYISNADTAYDTALDFAASMGFGYLRVVTDYPYDDTFDLDLLIKRVANPFTVYGDPRSEEADSSDWDLSFVTEMITRAEFKAKYPDAEEVDWRSDDRDDHWAEWCGEEEIRVAEYWTREKVARRLLKLSDGTTIQEEDFLQVDPHTGLSMAMIAEATGVTVVQERETFGYKVTQRTVTAAEVLSEVEWQGRYIPLVPVYGEEINIEGKRHFHSLIRQSKDAQRMFNYWRTASTELVALAPKAPFIGPKGSFNTDSGKWESANTVSHPYIEYDPVNGAPPPARQPFAGVPAGALQEALNASDDMKAILGLYDASLGARSNETSGKAIMARQREGDISTFHFSDNLARARRHLGRILIDLIPHVYKSERVARVMGEDGQPENVTLNQQVMDPNGIMRRLNDVTTGKYDITVSSGPSFTTRREEAAFQMTEMIRAFPPAAPVIGPHLAKNLDWPGAEEISKELEMLSPAKQAQQPPPDPMQDPKVQLAQAQLEMKKAEAVEDAKIQREKLQLEREKAELDAALKIQEHQADMEMMREKHVTSIQQSRESAMTKLHGDTVDAMGSKPEEGVIHPLVMLIDSIQQSNQATQAALMQGSAQVAEAIVQSNQATQQALVESNAMVAQALAAANDKPKTITMTTSQGKQLKATVN